MAPDPGNDMNEFNVSRHNVQYADEKKGKGGIIALVIILVLVTAATLVLVLDIGGVRTGIGGWLRNAPLIGGLFPPVEYEEEDPIDAMSEAEMRQHIRNLENQINGLEGRLSEANTNLANANARIAHLSRFEARWNEYRNAEASFTQMLAHNDPINFVEFFQRIVNHDLVSQDILAQAFGEAEAINIFNAELMELVRTYNAMEADRAAEDLVRMRAIDLNLSVRLLRAMSTSRRGEIFDAMDYTDSTLFAVLLSTEPPTFTPLVPPPYLPEIPPPLVEVLTPGLDDEYEYEENGENDNNNDYDDEDPNEE